MDILEYISHHVGYIVNERFINIPAQIAPTTFKSLWSEIERAKTKAMEYNLSYYLLINKTCRLPKMGGGRKRVKCQQMDVVYTNMEEQLFHENALIRFDYSVDNERDTGMQGSWDDQNDVQMEATRFICLVPLEKIPLIQKILGTMYMITWSTIIVSL